tara:strand:- start:366 stop:1493 length:1128 start_codon:yes stop_codon:yes gene_type:complete
MIETDFIKKINLKAREEGFEQYGIANFNGLDFYSKKLEEYIDKNYHGDMKWLKDKVDIRKNPINMWAEAKSAFVFGLNYAPEQNPLMDLNKKSSAYISAYARRKDYHKVIKSKLKSIARYMTSISDIKLKIFVDTAPLMEKPLAALAGIGWFGKNTNIISNNYGTWLFLGTILTNYPFKKNIESRNKCGTCDACNTRCPTKAFTKPFILDARKCISYLTIEHKGHIEIKFREAIGNRIFGCDDCLAICPWNKFAKKHEEIKFNYIEKLDMPKLDKLISFEEDEYRDYFAGTPIRRLGYARFLRNILIAVGNSKDRNLVPLVVRKLDNKYEEVKAMAIWALSSLDKSRFFIEKNKRYQYEEIEYLKKEWENVGAES